MSVDPGVLDAYLTTLQAEVDQRQDELGQVGEQLKTATLEQAAIAQLPKDTSDALAAAAVTGRLDAKALQTKRDELRTEIQAIRDLAAAAKGAV